MALNGPATSVARGSVGVPEARVHVHIGDLRLPRQTGLDRDELARRVETELARLLLADPRALGRGSAQVRWARGDVHVGSAASTATVAHALARAIHLRLTRGEGRA